MSYYIISLQHTHKTDEWLTFWRPENAGYAYAKEYAGVYPEFKEGYHDGPGNMPIKSELIVRLFMGIQSQKWTAGKLLHMVPNCKAVWDELGLRMTKNGLERK